MMKEAILRGHGSGAIRDLGGFKKGYRIPDAQSAAAHEFIRRAGVEEVKAHAEKIHQGIREKFGYKRREVDFGCADGAATITTPDFDVNISIRQDPADAGRYVIETDVGTVRNPDVAKTASFSELFSGYCDAVVVEFVKPISVEEKIDAIEDIPELRKHLAYESDCSSLTLELPSPNIRIHITREQMQLSLPGPRDLKALLANAQSALSAIHDAGVVRQLPS